MANIQKRDAISIHISHGGIPKRQGICPATRRAHRIAHGRVRGNRASIHKGAGRTRNPKVKGISIKSVGSGDSHRKANLKHPIPLSRDRWNLVKGLDGRGPTSRGDRLSRKQDLTQFIGDPMCSSKTAHLHSSSGGKGAEAPLRPGLGEDQPGGNSNIFFLTLRTRVLANKLELVVGEGLEGECSGDLLPDAPSRGVPAVFPKTHALHRGAVEDMVAVQWMASRSFPRDLLRAVLDRSPASRPEAWRND